MDLMAHHDGEMPADERDRLRETIADDATARAKLEALGQISELVRGEIESEVEGSLEAPDPFGAMWRRIERGIEANGVAGEAAEPATAAPAKAKERPGVLASIREWMERYRGQLVTGAVSAAAAGALVWFLRPPHTSVEYVEVDSTSPENALVTPAALEPQPPEVENLEVYDGTGVVFTIPGEGEEDSTTAVIWLTPPENSVEGPI